VLVAHGQEQSVGELSSCGGEGARTRDHLFYFWRRLADPDQPEGGDVWHRW
jgi:hypothetical protein